MPNPMDLSDFPTLVDARYSEILEEELADTTDVIPEIYNVRTTDRLEERSSAVGGLGSWTEFTGTIDQQSIYEQYETTSRPREYATMTVVTRRMVHDDFSGVFNDGLRFRPMVRAGIVTRQEHATRLFELINVVDTHFFTHSEGVAIASTAHTTRTPGVSTTTGFSNYTTAVLSPVSLRAALIAGRKIKSSEGKRMNLSYDEIFLPVDLVPVYNEIANTPAGLDVPFLNQNQESRERTGIRKIIALPFWTSATGWVLSNSRLRRELVWWYDSEEPDYGRMTEFDTKQIKSSGYMRYGTHVRGWRWAYVGGV